MSEETATPADIILAAYRSMRRSLHTIHENLLHLSNTSQDQFTDKYKLLLDFVQLEELNATDTEAALAELLSHVHIQHRSEFVSPDSFSSQQDLEEPATWARVCADNVEQRDVLQQLAQVFDDASAEFITDAPAEGRLTLQDILDIGQLLHPDEQVKLQQFQKFLAQKGFTVEEAAELTSTLRMQSLTPHPFVVAKDEITNELLRKWVNEGMLGKVKLAHVNKFLELVEPFCMPDKPLVKKDAVDIATIILAQIADDVSC